MYDKKQLKLYISPEILKKFKILAIEENIKYSAYIEKLMQEEIEKKSKRYVYHKNSEGRKAYFF